MAGLDALIIGRMRHDNPLAGFRIHMRLLENAVALFFGVFKMVQQGLGVGNVEIPARIFLFGLTEHVTIRQRYYRIRIVKRHFHNVLHAQYIHRQAF